MEFCDFPESWEWNNHPNWLSLHHFLEGLGSTTNQYKLINLTSPTNKSVFLLFSSLGDFWDEPVWCSYSAETSNVNIYWDLGLIMCFVCIYKVYINIIIYFIIFTLYYIIYYIILYFSIFLLYYIILDYFLVLDYYIILYYILFYFILLFLYYIILYYIFIYYIILF